MASLAESVEAGVEDELEVSDLGKRNTFLTLDMKRNSAGDLTELSEEMWKNGKKRLLVLDTVRCVISYFEMASDKNILKGEFLLEKVEHIYFDIDERHTDDQPQKKYRINFDIGTRDYQFSPFCHSDLQYWLREMCKLYIMSEKITQRTVNCRGTLSAITGDRLEQLLGIHDMKSRRFHEENVVRSRHIASSTVGIESQSDLEGIEIPLADDERDKLMLRAHVHGVTHDAAPLLLHLPARTSMKRLVAIILEQSKEKAHENYLVRFMLNGKRFVRNPASAWNRGLWFNVNSSSHTKIWDLEYAFFRKCTPLAALQQTTAFRSQEALTYIELVPEYLVPQLQIVVSIERVQLNKDASTGKQYANYMVCVENGSLKWVLARRFSEFVAFQGALSDAFSSLPMDQRQSLMALPRLPSKTLSKNFALAFLDKRRLHLQRYTQRLLSHPWASSRPEVLSFLGFMSHDKKIEKRDVNAIHISKLKDVVQSGDVLLFKMKNTMSGLQRVVTRSAWDHVAMVVRRSDAIMDLLEATGDGVVSYPLCGRLSAYSEHLATKIEIRRLEGNLPSKDLLEAKFIEFVDKVEGKPYSLTPKKLIVNDAMEDSSEKAGYFCSELVAAAYRDVGLLPDDKLSANMFWPSSFMPSGLFERSLAPGVTLGESMEINCREVEVGFARQVVRRRTKSARLRLVAKDEKAGLPGEAPTIEPSNEKDVLDLPLLV